MKNFITHILIVSFLFSVLWPVGSVQATPLALNGQLPKPGVMVDLSPAYKPALIKGLKVNPSNPFLFDFIVDVGQDNLSGEALFQEGQKMIRYFLASLAVPEDDLWVNLSPYEKDKIIPQALGQTGMGRDMLAQDYLLKQLSASLIYPEKELGKKFWDRVYARINETYGGQPGDIALAVSPSTMPSKLGLKTKATQVNNLTMDMNMFNKIWIMADKAEVFEKGQMVFVTKSHLKVMLEEDYLALTANSPRPDVRGTPSDIASSVVKDIVLPEIEREVNTGKNFANLRQIFNAIILATWYKQNLKQSIINQVYTNQNKVKGITPKNSSKDNPSPEKIYEQYLQAYKKGVFNYIKEDVSLRLPAVAGGALATKQSSTPRKYFSGGVVGKLTIDRAQVTDVEAINFFSHLKLFNVSVQANMITRAPQFNAAMQSSGILVKSVNNLPDVLKALRLIRFSRERWDTVGLLDVNRSVFSTYHFDQGLLMIDRKFDEQHWGITFIGKNDDKSNTPFYIVQIDRTWFKNKTIGGVVEELYQTILKYNSFMQHVVGPALEDVQPYSREQIVRMRDAEIFLTDFMTANDLTNLKHQVGLQGQPVGDFLAVNLIKNEKKVATFNIARRLDRMLAIVIIPENHRETYIERQIFVKEDELGQTWQYYLEKMLADIQSKLYRVSIKDLTDAGKSAKPKNQAMLSNNPAIFDVSIQNHPIIRDELLNLLDAPQYVDGIQGVKVAKAPHPERWIFDYGKSSLTIEYQQDSIFIRFEIVEGKKVVGYMHLRKRAEKGRPLITSFDALRILSENFIPEVNEAMASDPGGIDLTSKAIDLKVQKQGQGVNMAINSQQLKSIREQGIEGLIPVVLKITPIDNITRYLNLS